MLASVTFKSVAISRCFRSVLGQSAHALDRNRMTFSSVHALLKTSLGVLLALMVSSIGTSTAARAGCLGHYLKEGSKAEKPRATAYLDLLEASGALAGFSDPTRDEPVPAPPPPCRGAFCSGQPSTPDFPVPPAPSDSQQEWALPLGERLQAPPCSFRHEGAPLNPDPADPTGSIFHPPRV